MPQIVQRSIYTPLSPTHDVAFEKMKEIHHSERKFEAACRKVENEPQISPENKKFILSYAKTKLAKGGPRSLDIKT